MALFADLRVLYHLLLKPLRGESHADRMENFYRSQAAAYDGFRQRLLHGREDLYRALEVPPGGIWVELGGGTGSNLEFLGDRIQKLEKVYVVDLSESLLQVARRRAQQKGWGHVHPVAADATCWQPPEGRADVVTFSYSLTMIPDWFAAIENAHAMLREGGRIGVVDFYVSRKFPKEGHQRHGWLTRSFWPLWFGADNVCPSADHVPFLEHRFATEHFREGHARVPYLPLVRVPYYCYLGARKKDDHLRR